MGPAQSIKTCLARSFQFKGRASRSEFWWFYGFMVVALLGLEITGASEMDVSYITAAMLFAIPLFAAAYRRIQDVGKPGWLVFVPFAIIAVTMQIARFSEAEIPKLIDTYQSGNVAASMPTLATLIAGYSLFSFVLMALVVFLRRPSDPSTNKYGPNPNEVPS
ncbi:DUF805 domain-containing protein [Yoonia sp. BS5-3]|uniref:DUF805 domain-containing protein n=1 Tax=Yoonia phaeophyticola TaxID=3137369 RepID=A0ABZ2V6R8_9RHOB